MKSYITAEECKPSLLQTEAIEELAKITGGRIVWGTDNVVAFVGPNDCRVQAQVYDNTLNLKINWIDHPTTLGIIHLLVNRRDK